MDQIDIHTIKIFAASCIYNFSIQILLAIKTLSFHLISTFSCRKSNHLSSLKNKLEGLTQWNFQQLHKANTEVNDKMADFESNSEDARKQGSGGWFNKLIKWIELDHEPGLTNIQLFLTNNDLKPLEAARRTWGWMNFVAFWIADSFNINTWQIAATGVQAGLSWWQVWISVWLGYGIVGCFVLLTARIGSMYHITFPVSCRSSFGIYGAYWPVLNRVVMACIWYGVQAWLGGECVQLMLEAVFPQTKHMKNGIPNSGTTTLGFLSFFLFCLFSLPAIWFPPHQIRHLFTVKSIVCPIAGIAFLVWTIVKAGGIGPVVHQGETIHGSEKGWAFVKSMMNCIANFATLIVNAPDFSRMATTKNSAKWSQVISIPVCFSITSLIGILVSSASTILYGETLWSPLDVLSQFLDGNKSGSRAGVFFIAFAFSLAQLGTNISANSLSAGTDMAALFPRFINIRRGGFICAAAAFCYCPWNLFKSSNSFTSYLSSYSVFLSAISGVVFCDYYLVRKGNLVLKDLYNNNKFSTYMFTLGCNWRAYVAYISGILINIVGFAGDVGKSVPIGATYVYNVNYFCGYIISAVMYYILCHFFPIPGNNEKFHDEYMYVEDFHVALTSSSEQYETYDAQAVKSDINVNVEDSSAHSDKKSWNIFKK